MQYASFDLEFALWQRGFNLVCGIDEVGRGCFAGPIVAAAVIFPNNFISKFQFADSKLLSPKRREALAKYIKDCALNYSIAEISVEDINKFRIVESNQRAFRKALFGLSSQPDYILIDAFYIENVEKNIQQPVKKGDRTCASVAAASILAKVYRDDRMVFLNDLYPEYGFSKNKGYGTLAHRNAIKKFGLTKLHRTSFKLAKYLNEPNQ